MKTIRQTTVALLLSMSALFAAGSAQASCSDHFKWIYSGSRSYTKALIKGAWNTVKLDRVTNNQLDTLKHAKKKSIRRKKVRWLHLDLSDNDFANLVADMDQKNQLCNGSRLMTYKDAIDAIADRLQTEVYSKYPNGGMNLNNGGCGGRGGCDF